MPPILSIIVPVYNEARNLEALVERFMNAPCPIGREWIFVDDGSSDGSLAILQRLQRERGFKILPQKPNQGKGASIIRGIREAAGDIIMFQDADFEYDPSDIPALLQPILDGKADAVYGSRFMKNTAVHWTSHYFANRLLTWLSNALSGLHLTDMETCYKIFRADLLKSMNLTSNRFGIEVEMTAYLAKERVRVHELPIGYSPRNRLEGKKINWKDGVAALLHVIRFNLLTSREKAFQNIAERYRSSP